MFLELKNTDIGYDLPLIEGINTGLSLGEICLLIGNNGVGKTTLIKSILHQIPVLKGSIEVNGFPVSRQSVRQLAEKIAVVFSKGKIPSNYTVRDLISLGKFIHYPYYFDLNDCDRQHVVQIIDEMRLNEYADFFLSELSDGNLQKAFIGRALAQNSPMIIMDEPTTHLDENNKIVILQLLRDLARKHNKLILFSSHDWRLAKEFADKVWLISENKLDSGITEEVLLRHQDLLNPDIFSLGNQFSPPEISAPPIYREMMYSFLQKNFQKDLSGLWFNFSDPYWEISSPETQNKFTSFKEIAEFLAEHH